MNDLGDDLIMPQFVRKRSLPLLLPPSLPSSLSRSHFISFTFSPLSFSLWKSCYLSYIISFLHFSLSFTFSFKLSKKTFYCFRRLARIRNKKWDTAPIQPRKISQFIFCISLCLFAPSLPLLFIGYVSSVTSQMSIKVAQKWFHYKNCQKIIFVTGFEKLPKVL